MSAISTSSFNALFLDHQTGKSSVFFFSVLRVLSPNECDDLKIISLGRILQN